MKLAEVMKNDQDQRSEDRDVIGEERNIHKERKRRKRKKKHQTKPNIESNVEQLDIGTVNGTANQVCAVVYSCSGQLPAPDLMKKNCVISAPFVNAHLSIPSFKFAIFCR